MTRSHYTLAAGLALLLAGAVQADDRPGRRTDRPGRERPGIGRFAGQFAPLLTRQEREKLNLSTEQKERVDRIVKEFEAGQRAGLEKIQEGLRKAREDRNPQALREMVQKLREGREKARAAAEARLKEVLNEEQKKKFEELKKDRPAERGFPGRPGIPGRPGFGRPFAPGQILPPFVQQRLDLTKEQREQLEKLQKEVNERLEKILTEEQRKQLKEMRERGPGRFGRPGRPERPRRER